MIRFFTQRAEWIDMDGCLSETGEVVWSCMESGSQAERLVILTGPNRNKLRPLSSRAGRTWDDCSAPGPPQMENRNNLATVGWLTGFTIFKPVRDIDLEKTIGTPLIDSINQCSSKRQDTSKPVELQKILMFRQMYYFSLTFFFPNPFKLYLRSIISLSHTHTHTPPSSAVYIRTASFHVKVVFVIQGVLTSGEHD